MKKYLFVLVGIILVSGCSAQPENNSPLAQDGCQYFGVANEVAPDWICSAKVPEVTSSYSAVGVSENSAGGVGHQRNLAILDAQQLIGKQLESDVAQLIQKKLATLGVEGNIGGTGATSEETVMRTNVQLKGLNVIRSQRGPDGYMYVLVSLPEKALEQNVEHILAVGHHAELASEISDLLTSE